VSGAVDPSTRLVLERHLWAGEELLWGERPGSVAAVAAQGARRGYLAAVPVTGTVMAVLLYAYFKLAHILNIALTPVAVYAGPVVVMGMGIGVGAAWGWWRARRSAPDVVYGLTTRRLIVARGDTVEWISGREFDGVELRGSGVVVTRRRTEIEYQWSPERTAQDGDLPGESTISEVQELEQRQLRLVSLRDPVGLDRLIRATLRP
jgi:hypothetical protein